MTVSDPESVAALQKIDATENSITVNWTAPLSGQYNFFEMVVKAGYPPQNIQQNIYVNM